MRTKSVVESFSPLAIPAQNLQVFSSIFITLLSQTTVEVKPRRVTKTTRNTLMSETATNFITPVIVHMIESQKINVIVLAADTATSVPRENFSFECTLPLSLVFLITVKTISAMSSSVRSLLELFGVYSTFRTYQ